ncbi:DeoR/GlpR family DNA-binding transcription regulator [Frigidibacter sp. ROC022]|uniref:DeoR/GlpR family DNA-binding transcription regulator n=1 Tax=Frigidibacter sp. ROC022 TaxID=2971796 RepID=UPI00215A454E|nr:DeoR/GlpR family DNA-binding transcription regulator [Frigidibacter sp. ROC022]MCR8726160.1 DeoR/GlpR family DNA-binding transcription regulator [Frigidibacter sp. ROC022]
MAQSFRKPQILDIARIEGRVLVDDLAARMGVTAQTIRKDLSELADAGKLERVHGGAVLPSGTSNIAYEQRRVLQGSAKAAIGRAVAADIPANASLFLNIGTTTEAVARELLGHQNLLVVTNNMNVANILLANPECEIILAGGRVRRSDGGLVGNLTVSVIEQFKFDFAVIGCSAMDDDGDLLDFDLQEVGVSQTILRHSRSAFLVSDHSKLLRSAPVRISSLSAIDTFYTDRALPEGLARKCRDWKTEVRLCGSD